MAPGRRRELPSFLGKAGVLRRKGSVEGPAARSRGAGRVFVRLRGAPGSPNQQLQLQQQPTFQLPSENRAAASVLLFRHLPGARESAEPHSPRSCRRLPSPPHHSPEKEARKAAGRGEGAGRRPAALDCGRQVRCSARSRAASRRRQQDPHGGCGTGFKAWEKFLHFEKEDPLVGSCWGGDLGAAPTQEPGLVSSTFAIRCLLRSCGVSGRREGLTHARTQDCRSLHLGVF